MDDVGQKVVLTQIVIRWSDWRLVNRVRSRVITLVNQEVKEEDEDG